ncbi:hypothetical protein O7626_14530 [Micromonospora sp. WMMD1102]|uniref:hypothetical protein n=1 Tax=Micromonospora sp. WMMD1102 TaxID=3016105 RepID=UPI0024158792|nr:hypothetical protein [Micromonospora sp. WMMD1102]MDG4787131.1 hypothetical protein [Micromonospora sp. WMMD1102]
MSITGLGLDLIGAITSGWKLLPELYGIFLASAITSAVMTGLMRKVGPVTEAYRLGVLAGARQQRQQCRGHRCDRQCGQFPPTATAHTTSGPAVPGTHCAGSDTGELRVLTLVRR